MGSGGRQLRASPACTLNRQDPFLATEPPVDDRNDMPSPPSGGDSDIAPISIVDEMKTSYLDYAMSVIVSRALPDVRDGLKPVHRRILWTCQENGYRPDRQYRKCARIVGDTMGKYHPHGNQAIYDALARMVQPWSMRVPLIDGQGNFGSMDPDPPAAERYTEARLAKVAMALLEDIDRDTVDFTPNYDATEREPQVLPARFPNILVNGAGGIAVGMATNIPPHNLGEVLAACRAYMDDPAISSEGLMEHVKGPDFPTGGFILGLSGIRGAYTAGRGSILLRSRHHVEEGRGDRRSIVLTEIPYQVGKNGLVEKIAEAAKDKRIEGVADIRDESNREGVRIVIDLKRDATPDVVLNQLWRHTPAQSSFPANMLAIRGGRPETLTLRDFMEAFIRFREEVITRRSKFELLKARERANILLGLVLAVTNLDEVVKLIRGSASPAEAREKRIEREDMVVTVTMAGYIKRTPLTVFREQKRGGKGRAGMATKEEDAVTNLFVTSTHNPVLFFSNLGQVYRMKVWRLPEGGPNTRGRPMVNLLPLAEGETISTVLPLPEDEAEWGGLHIMFATARGTVRRNSMDAFTNIRASGKRAMRFGGDDEEENDINDRLIGVSLLTEGDDVLLATRNGKAIRFKATDVREFQSRDSQGVRGIRLAAGDEVISMSILHRVGTSQEEREAYLRFAAWKGEKDVSVAQGDESDEEVELEGGDEIGREEGATVGESELEKPADPEAK